MKYSVICRLKNKFLKTDINENLVRENNLCVCNFCTIGSSKYLIKLIAQYNSLLKSGCFFHLWVLCMDDFTYEFLTDLNLEYLRIISINTLEEDHEILQAKDGKEESEYCWMLKAPLIEYVLSQNDIDSIIYVDSDIYFFKNPSFLFDRFQFYSIYLCPQRDRDDIELKYGKYQAGLVGFKKDREGMDALIYWKSKCLEWCRNEYDPVGKRFGDQKYLEEISQQFYSINFEDNFGVNAAPWNCIYNQERTVITADGTPRVNGDEIILFHFACITMFNETEFDLWNLDKLNIPENILAALYIPYIIELMDAAQLILYTVNDAKSIIFSNKSSDEAKSYFQYNEFSTKLMEYGDFYHICSIVSNNYLIKIIALYKSLLQHQPNFHLWLCVIDAEAYEILKSMEAENITVINVTKLNKNIRTNHSIKEYCWMLKSAFIKYLFHNYKLEKILYCDADMYFYLPIKYIYYEWDSYSYYVTTQRASDSMELRNGQFQAGLLGFKNDDYGRKILSWWEEKCSSWCYDWYDEKFERWGDQKYLDKIPLLFENIKLSHNLGINAGPWNLILNNRNYHVAGYDNHVYINNFTICCYHFGSLNIIGTKKYDLWFRSTLDIKQEILDLLYIPYIKSLKQVMDELLEKQINLNIFMNADSEISSKNLYILEEGSR